MTFKILPASDRDELRRVLPKAFWQRLDQSRMPVGPYSLLLFTGPGHEVVLSPRVREALGASPAGVQIVAAGQGFTAEGLAALADASAHVITLGDFYWTDESYLAVHA